MIGNIYKRPFVKNTLVLTTGTSIAQFLPLLIYPILARIYDPGQFGTLAVFTSVVSIIAVISTGKYESAILVVEDDTGAANIAVLSILISIILGIIIFIPLFLFKGQINLLIGYNLGYWILLCPFVAVFINIFNGYNEWCVRKKYYVNLSLNKITNSFAVTIGKLLLSFTKYINSGLIIGDIIGRFLTAVACVVRIIYKDWNSFKYVTYSGMKKQAVKYIDFPKFTMPAQLLNTIGGSVPILILGAYFNDKEIGYFAMTLSILSVPISVISYSVRDVFRQKANEVYILQGEFRDLFVKLFKMLAGVTILVSLAVYYFLPLLFGLVLGEQWEIAGKYAQILLPMMAIDFIAMSLSGVLIVTNKLKQNFIWQVYYSTISVISLLIGSILWHNIYYTLILFSLGRCSAYGYLLFISYRYSKGGTSNV